MSGVKGRSGRKPAYEALNTHELLKMAESSLRQYFKDSSISLPQKAALAAMLYSKAIKQTTETQLRIIKDNDLAILAKYDSALPDDKLKRIAQDIQEAQVIDTTASPALPDGSIHQIIQPDSVEDKGINP